jgi:hypothetical protein
VQELQEDQELQRVEQEILLQLVLLKEVMEDQDQQLLIVVEEEVEDLLQ